MTLRNAFEDLSVENTQVRLARALDNLSARFAMDAGGRLRVTADSSSQVNTSTYWGAFNVAPTYYSSGAPTAMDAREQQALAATQNFNIVRTQRWAS